MDEVKADIPESNNAAGEDLSAKSKVLETGAAITQDFRPIKQICAHLNAFHAYADEPGRCVEANHYCSHLNEEVRQCVLYDSPGPNARLIGVEYMISPRLYETLDPEERKLWHSHVFEVKSGMLIMPQPQKLLDTQPPALFSTSSEAPPSAWEVAETKEMEDVIKIYGKVYHLWQTDRGHTLPLGEPKLMTSYTAEDQFDFEKVVGERDERFGSDYRRKKEVRKHIEEPQIHLDADQTWKK